MIARLLPRRTAAFSLIEVAISVGLIAFALTAILGLMSIGVGASRDSIDDTVMGLIAQDVADRVRTQVASMKGAFTKADTTGVPVDITSDDFRWNPFFTQQPGYTTIGNSTLPLDPETNQPGETANAYYSREGVFVREATSGAEIENYYKAAIYIRPLPPTSPTADVVSYASLNLPPTGSAPSMDYPVLAVSVQIGWPTQPVKDGKVVGPVVNHIKKNAVKTAFTFLLAKP